MEHSFILRGDVVEALTDDEFFQLCVDNREVRFERTATGEIVIMSPSGSRTSVINNKLAFQLTLWNEKHQLGVVSGSDGGFTLADTSMRAPDVAWTQQERWDALSPEQQARFAPICPDFVIELKSPSDRLAVLQQKMQDWIANGSRLAWLIDPETEQVHIYRADGTTGVVQGFDGVVSGEDVLPGFALKLDALR